MVLNGPLRGLTGFGSLHRASKRLIGFICGFIWGLGFL